jgi:cytochrome c oxidase cbb3-type subunit 4
MFDYETLAGFAQTWGTVGFCILFALAAWYALNPRNRGVFDAAARTPLEKD